MNLSEFRESMDRLKNAFPRFRETIKETEAKSVMVWHKAFKIGELSDRSWSKAVDAMLCGDKPNGFDEYVGHCANLAKQVERDDARTRYATQPRGRQDQDGQYVETVLCPICDDVTNRMGEHSGGIVMVWSPGAMRAVRDRRNDTTPEEALAGVFPRELAVRCTCAPHPENDWLRMVYQEDRMIVCRGQTESDIEKLDAWCEPKRQNPGSYTQAFDEPTEAEADLVQPPENVEPYDSQAETDTLFDNRDIF